MEQLFKKLKEGIAEAKKYHHPTDQASWNYQYGVLLSADEAKAVLKALTKANKISFKPPVSGSLLAEIRQAVADYMKTEGCSCCGDYEGHKVNAERLGKLLKVKKYDDGSGYDFSKYRSQK